MRVPREFINRSQLSKSLTPAELRQLQHSLMTTTDSGQKEVNYTKFCTLSFGPYRGTVKGGVTASDGHTGVINNFRIAATIAAENGRPFSALASLFDPSNTGNVEKTGVIKLLA